MAHCFGHGVAHMQYVVWHRACILHALCHNTSPKFVYLRVYCMYILMHAHMHKLMHYNSIPEAPPI